MRWADIDALNHVNNVVFRDYAAESREILVADGIVGEDEPVKRIAVDFLQPLLLTRRPVRITSEREGDELMQEITGGESATVFARVTTTFGPRVGLEHGQSTFEPYSLRVRRSDLDLTGAATLTKAFEFFQEARVLRLANLRDDWNADRFVTAHVDVTYGAPILWRREPYPVRTWISRIGDSSFTIESVIADERTVYASGRTVQVSFDLTAQVSRKLGDDEKALLATFIPS